MTELTHNERDFVIGLMNGPLLISRYNPQYSHEMRSDLVKRGLIATVVCRPGGTIYALTDAGREALKANAGVIPDME